MTLNTSLNLCEFQILHGEIPVSAGLLDASEWEAIGWNEGTVLHCGHWLHTLPFSVLASAMSLCVQASKKLPKPLTRPRVSRLSFHFPSNPV